MFIQVKHIFYSNVGIERMNIYRWTYGQIGGRRPGVEPVVSFETKDRINRRPIQKCTSF